MLRHLLFILAMSKRPLDNFFKPTQSKKARVESSDDASDHATYPWSILQLPPDLNASLGFAPATEGKAINDQPDLDLLYFQPYTSRDVAKDLFDFLRDSLFFYRVQYKIKRGLVETQINTPRFTTVFGVDGSSRFAPDGSLLDARTGHPVPKDRYKCQPRPIPGCLDSLRTLVEGSTGAAYNFCLVNYYADGNDSISYHSDDERFLGPEPTIASISLGGTRDFLMKHKPVPTDPSLSERKPLKLPLGSGDMVLMRGRTQSNWLHSIPKRKGGESGRGRINITFRRAMVKGGTENYYQYNVGTGGIFKWNGEKKEMVSWRSSSAST